MLHSLERAICASCVGKYLIVNQFWQKYLAINIVAAFPLWRSDREDKRNKWFLALPDLS
jgi:hypothetical protein